ncbi:MAG TPA: serine/threonine-protein kinase [Polyangiaceae bacterium]
MSASVQDFGVAAGAALNPGDEIAGRYRIESLLAWGGMAAIYVCDDAVLGRQIALKVLRPEAGSWPGIVDRLLNEARALAKLRSPHVMRVLDWGTLQLGGFPDIPFIALELLEGSDLREALSRNGPLALPLVASYMTETCEGLAEAHAQGIVHRDIKPENIFLARGRDGSDVVKLIDFGISKQLAQHDSRPLTLASDCLGSPQYMSPEQMRGLPVDARTDIWALGAVMFECVTGQPLFPGATVFEISAQVLRSPLPDLRARWPELPDTFLRIIERCLQREPSDRFQNVAELAHALEAFASRECVSTSRRIAKVLAIDPPRPSRPFGGLVTALPAQADAMVEDDDLEPLRIAGLRSYRGLWLSLLVLAGLIFTAYRYPERMNEMTNRARMQLDAWVAGQH